MDKNDKARAISLAKFHIKEWLRLHNPTDCWENQATKQAHYDALNGLRYYKFIQDFRFEDVCNVCIDNQWY